MGMNCVEVIHKDSEIADINATGAKDPGERIYGCFFHLSQLYAKRLCPCCHQSRYNIEKEFAVKVHNSFLLQSTASFFPF